MSTSRSLVSCLLFAGAVACQPVRPQSTPDAAETTAPGPIPDVGLQSALVFPPAPAARRDRAQLPEHLAASQADAPPEAPSVSYPELDASDHSFEFSGKVLRVVFDQAMERANDGVVPAASFSIEPPVKGKAQFTGDRHLEFIADAPFDPNETYEVVVSGLQSKKTGPQANALPMTPWRAKFTAEPEIEIAGKIISYIPVPGQAEVVATHPLPGEQVAPRTKLAVLFDQPVSLAAVKDRIRLTDGTDAISTTLRRPKKKTFRGIKVDSRYVVEVVPKKKLKPGQGYELEAAGFGKDITASAEFNVAPPLAFERADCGYGYDAAGCEWDEGVLRTDGREVALVFNNTVAQTADEVLRAITVEPKVRNLSAWSSYYEGRVYLYGGFEPSKSYKVTVRGLRDVHGSKLHKAQSFRVETAPLHASLSMPEGLLVLDQSTTRNFGVTTRNVGAAHLMLWPVPDGTDAWREARGRAEGGSVPEGVAPIQVRFTPTPKRDEHVVTKLDLSRHLHAGTDYLATVRMESSSYGAVENKMPVWGASSSEPIALLTPGHGDAMAIHARASANGSVVHVARLDGGEPVAGAELFLGDQPLGARTDDLGFARLDLGQADLDGQMLRARVGSTEVRLELSGGTLDEKRLVPELANGSEPSKENLAGMILTDRGIYRPGARVFIKGSVRRRTDDRLAPVPMLPLQVRVLGPGGQEVFSQKGFADEMGSVSVAFDVPATASLGRHRVILSPSLKPELELAQGMVQVAEFEPPRFTVDVTAEQSKESGLSAKIEGRYLFGAAMEGSHVDWSLRRSEAGFEPGVFTSAGFDFRRRRSWWDDESEGEAWLRSGAGSLDSDGLMTLTQALELGDAHGPQRFMLEAEISDDSYRTIAGRGSLVLHPAERYAGLKVNQAWADVGDAIPVELGVIDQAGLPVVGARVEARLARVDWKYTRKRGPKGSTSYEWHRKTTPADKCEAKTKRQAVTCRLTPKRGGSYEVTATVDGRAGGVRTLYAWDDDWVDPVVEPNKGHRLELVSDKSSYEAGDTAKILVTNPFSSAIAILTVERDGIEHHERRRIDGSAAIFDVQVSAAHAPHVHATVTLLPVGEKGEAATRWRFGALRLPVSDAASRLEVSVEADRTAYEPGDDGSIEIRVMEGGKPVVGAEVALSVVDEGILRMTNFHAADPNKELRPGRALRVLAADTRDRLAAAHQRSHVAGDGAGVGSQSVTEARRDFVKTMMWKPDLRTDAQGVVRVPMDLPDNLTTFRMMAVALDADGRGGSDEEKFRVRKRVMVIPAIPRFASVGDEFEAAAMVHNNTDKAVEGLVRLMGVAEKVRIDAGRSARVGFDVSTEQAGELNLDFSIEVAGKVMDSVEAAIPVRGAGIDDRPTLTAEFVSEREVSLQVPTSVRPDQAGQDWIDVTVGEHLEPELGARLSYLVDYPHGCVEQTTSSTLPLIAARDILPRVGVTRFDRAQIDDMIRSGLERLESMRTSSGGLAYWPGGTTPNVYGTAYAMRAVVRAEQEGIEGPPGLLSGMRRYLESRLLSSSLEPEVRAAIAQSLGELGVLSDSSADALWDTRTDQGVFGQASLAISLAALGGQDERVEELLNDIEGSFSADGRLTRPAASDDFYYYGSSRRTRAQAAIALVRLRPSSQTLHVLMDGMGEDLGSYTTQSTAYETLALAERMKRSGGDGAATVVSLDGEALTPHRELGRGTNTYRIPLAKVQGRRAVLRMHSDTSSTIKFAVSARWRRGIEDAMGLLSTTGEQAPDVFRLFTDSQGRPVALDSIDPGQVLRVALMVKLPVDEVARDRLGYLALTDRLAAGFEAVQPDLWTVAKVPELEESHPFYSVLRWSENNANHVEMHDDRVDIYFDRVWGSYVGASYLIRATTPGSFVVPPPAAELMYEADGMGYGAAARVTIR